MSVKREETIVATKHFVLSREDIDKFLKEIDPWAELNPSEFYVDYNDECPDNWVQLLLDAKTQEEIFTAKDEIYEDLMSNNWDYEHELREEAFKEFKQFLECKYDFEFTEDDEATLEELSEYFRDYHHVDYDSAISTLLSRARFNIVATPRVLGGQDAEGEEHYVAPHYDYEDDYRASLKKMYVEDLGIPEEQFEKFSDETMYCWTYLRICGRIDFSDLWEMKDPKPFSEIRITKDSTTLWHNSGNGSGNCWEPDLSCDQWFKADFRVDNNWRYGVDAVYGLTNSFWNNQLEVR